VLCHYHYQCPVLSSIHPSSAAPAAARCAYFTCAYSKHTLCNTRPPLPLANTQSLILCKQVGPKVAKNHSIFQQNFHNHNQPACCHQFTGRCSERGSPTPPGPRSSPLRLDPEAWRWSPAPSIYTQLLHTAAAHSLRYVSQHQVVLCTLMLIARVAVYSTRSQALR